MPTDLIPTTILDEWAEDVSIRSWARDSLLRQDVFTFNSIKRTHLKNSELETINKIQKLEEAFFNDGKALELQLIQQRATLSALRTLPLEILSLVLIEYFTSREVTLHGDDECFRTSFHLAPLLVCRQWRELALSLPSCWSRLKLKFKFIFEAGDQSDEEDDELYRVWDSEDLVFYFEQMLRHQIVWAQGEMIDVVVDNDQRKHTFISNIWECLYPHLRNLRSYSEFGASLFDYGNLGYGSDKWTSLRVGSGLGHYGCFAALKTLSLPLCWPTTPDLKNLHCPNLISLCLRSFNGSIDEFLKFLQKFPKLKIFTLESYYHRSPAGTSISDQEIIQQHTSVERIVVPDFSRDQPDWSNECIPFAAQVLPPLLPKPSDTWSSARHWAEAGL